MPDVPEIGRLRRVPSPEPLVLPGAEAGPPPIIATPTSVAAFVGRFNAGPFRTPLLVESASDTEAAGLIPGASSAADAVHLFFANGGRRAWIVRAPEVAGPAELTGALAALDSVNFSLLSTPDTAEMSGEDAAEVLTEAAAYVASRRAFFVADPPRTSGITEAVAWMADHGTLRSPNAAAYLPEVIAAEGDARIPASGAVAGIFARIDSARGVWKAPAGPEANLTGVGGVAYAVDGRGSEALAAAGLNPLRQVRSEILVWGARTMAGGDDSSSQWKYVNVRRLFLFLEASIEEGTRWAVFEPNGEPLWAKLRDTVGTFMEDLFRRGAFQGAKSSEAFYVKCDRSTMTQGDIDRGRVVLAVGFAPLRPAEFITLQIEVQTRTAAKNPPSVNEMLAAAAEWGRAPGIGFGAVVVGTKDRAADVAQRVATAAGADLQRIDLRHVVSKFIGETEKNLARLLDVAERQNQVLLFDETDALFARRTTPRDGDLGNLWQRLHRHRGIVVWAIPRVEKLHADVGRTARFIVMD